MSRFFARLLFVAGILLLSSISAAPAPRKLTRGREEIAVITTPLGKIAIRFFPEEAPGHVSYVKDLIRKHFYDGTTFHRVIPHFVIQGGDPNSKDADRNNDGDGEADRRLNGEFSTTFHYRPGTVGMARDDDPNSGSCQFFIALEDLPRLDGKYTIFGEVTEGLDVARRIADLPRDLKDNPLQKVPMRVLLQQVRVTKPIYSHAFTQEPSGEVLSGPGKPRAWDPGSTRWTAPALARGAKKSLGTEAWPGTPLDISLAEDGSVLDVRFEELRAKHAEEIVAAVKKWSFTPVRRDGKPIKARFAISSRGGTPEPTSAPGTPRQITREITPPAAAIPIPLAAGMKAPETEPLLRLSIDENGQVTDVSLEISTGNPLADEAAMEAARKMIFAPAVMGKAPVSVYVNLPGRFVEANLP
jgi:peptidyl-prolyl cis-trans isomerase B (cyclophilin B)